MNGQVQISHYERKDAELFYLTFIAKTVPSPEERASKHPQWPNLCAKHGAPIEAEATTGRENLGSRIIELGVHRLPAIPSREIRMGSLSDNVTPIQIKVLPSMNLKTLRAKSLKVLKIRPGTAGTVRLFALLPKDDSDEAVTLEMDCDADGGKEIDFWGLASGSGQAPVRILSPAKEQPPSSHRSKPQLAMDNDEGIESILYMCREVMVYRVPPRKSNAGYRAEEWGDLSAYLWKGRMRIVESGDKCTVRLEDSSTGEVFAQSPYDVSGTSVEPVLDSSRYFVLRVEDSGRKAYIGIGFAERPDAFDFNVALQDYTKRQKALQNQDKDDGAAPAPSPHLPAVKQDLSIKGSLGSISIPGGSSNATKPSNLAFGSGGSGIPLLPPPPSSKRR
ncbi:hypothetical protein FRB90_000151 [Tulasnella sp. 427]|nr:hypothetical protein FRB90_000151 [Tulasnella sp. 427]